MSLPIPARQRLVQPLRAARTLDRELRTFNTLPIGERPWRQHSGALVASIEKFAGVLGSPAEGFNAIRDWIEQLLGWRLAVGTHLFALEPFAPFDSTRGTTVLHLLDDALRDVADSVEAAKVPAACPTSELREAAAWWKARAAGRDGDDVIAAAFGMNESPVDTMGEFRADWVLQHYAYRSNELLQHLLPHLASLGVPGVVDILAAVSVVGWIVDCDDPVTAYAAMDAFVNRYITADSHIADLVTSHLEDSEPALRRARQAANRAVASAASVQADSELRAFALADVYKRILEGPFRQFSWGLYCLQRGEWESPPMLTSLRDRLVSSGGLLALVAKNAVLPDLRNSEAHETLAWDGFSEEFVTEGGRLKPSRVALALVLATSFAQGCEAGLSAVRSLRLQLDNALPLSDEVGRMPAWRRVQAFFGTNRLRLVDARLNARHAHLRVERLAFTDINPCFQALVLARRLLPDVETFLVSRGSGDEVVIVVGADALDAAMPVWEYAVSALDQLPLSTFLPVNFDARRRIERWPLACRSAVWIAVDDALDVIDGSPDVWSGNNIRLLRTRLQVVEMALIQTIPVLGTPSPRLESVITSVREVQTWLSSTPHPTPASVEDLAALGRLRTQWERWGPVPRHPNISDVDASDLSERQPSLLEPFPGQAYRTL